MSVDPGTATQLRDEIKAALTQIDPTVAQSLQHVMDDAAGLAVAEVAKWLRARCCHDDMHWGASSPEKCCYPLCSAARDLEATDAG